MRISFKGDYAIKSILYLSGIYNYESNNSRFVQISDISKTQDIPVKFLEQILLALKKAGYVKSQRGKKGGYAMARSPEHVRLGEIVRLTEGYTAPIACVSRSCYKHCDFEKKCVLKPVWEEIRKRTSDVVDNITFKELAEKERELIKQTVEAATFYI